MSAELELTKQLAALIVVYTWTAVIIGIALAGAGVWLFNKTLDRHAARKQQDPKRHDAHWCWCQHLPRIIKGSPKETL